MNMVKGSLLMEVVRLIRANKDLNWEKYLKPEDMELVRGKILPSNWYTLESYERMGQAIFMEVGKGDFSNVRQWGRFTIEELVGKSYKSLFQGLDTMSAFKKFVFFRRQFFKLDDENIEMLKLEPVGEKDLKIHVHVPLSTSLLEAYAHQLSGSFERLAELFGGKNPGTEILDKQWEGSPGTTIRVTWE
jgi:hypothetical protein